MIKLENVTKEFEINGKTFKAVDGVNLDIDKGEIFGIIGFSGAGKSTLVRCINLLEIPTSGAVYYDNENIMEYTKRELNAYRKNVSMIFQQFNLLEQRSVLDNVCYPLEISGVKKGEAQKRARELLKIVELSDKENAYPSQLSGGQKQRVAIARALATNPEVLLCDEATSALDPITTRSILSLLKEINHTLGVTIVIITHEMSVVQQICNRVAIMSEGVVQEYGTVKEIFLNPKSEVGKKLILPSTQIVDSKPTKSYIRIVFDGSSSYEPVVAKLILETGSNLNILGANMEDIDGSAFGQLLIEKPDPETLEKVKNYLEKQNIIYEEEEV